MSAAGRRIGAAVLAAISSLTALGGCSSLDAGSDEFTPAEAHDAAESLVVTLLRDAVGVEPDRDTLVDLAEPRACDALSGQDPDTAFFMGHFTGPVAPGTADRVADDAMAHLEGDSVPSGLTAERSTRDRNLLLFSQETFEGYFEAADDTWVLSLETRCAQLTDGER